MGEDQQMPASRAPTERAEEMIARLGRRFGEVRTAVSQRLEQTAGQGNASGSQRPAVERAEETFDQIGMRVGAFAAEATRRIQQLGARAREEIEDMWAEAQSVRQNTTFPSGSRSAEERNAAHHAEVTGDGSQTNEQTPSS